MLLLTNLLGNVKIDMVQVSICLFLFPWVLVIRFYIAGPACDICLVVPHCWGSPCDKTVTLLSRTSGILENSFPGIVKFLYQRTKQLFKTEMMLSWSTATLSQWRHEQVWEVILMHLTLEKKSVQMLFSLMKVMPFYTSCHFSH